MKVAIFRDGKFVKGTEREVLDANYGFLRKYGFLAVTKEEADKAKKPEVVDAPVVDASKTLLGKGKK